MGVSPSEVFITTELLIILLTFLWFSKKIAVTANAIPGTNIMKRKMCGRFLHNNLLKMLIGIYK